MKCWCFLKASSPFIGPFFFPLINQEWTFENKKLVWEFPRPNDLDKHILSGLYADGDHIPALFFFWLPTDNRKERKKCDEYASNRVRTKYSSYIDKLAIPNNQPAESVYRSYAWGIQSLRNWLDCTTEILKAFSLLSTKCRCSYR